MRRLLFFVTLFLISSASFATWHQYDTAYVSECITSSHSSCSPVPYADYGLPSNTPWRQRQSSTAQCGKPDGSTGTQINYACEYSDVDPCTSPESWQQATQSCGCPAGQIVVNNECVAPCPANQTRNEVTGICEGPCTASQFAEAQSQVAVGNDTVHVVVVPISAGLRTVNESTTVGYLCVNTCRGKNEINVRIGTITNTTYEVKDWTHSSVEQTGCDNLPAGTTTTTAVQIGAKPDGGCRSGFAYGEVNNVSGCYGAPSSGASSDSGGGGPQNNSGNPGGADGAGNNSDGTNQNGAGGACNSGYHDSGGTCVKDASSGGGGGDNPTQCLPADTRSECQSGMPSHTHGDAQSFGAAINKFHNDLKQTNLVSSISSMSSAFSSAGAGACPSPTFEVFGASYTISLHCTLFDQYSGILSAVFMAMWCVMGIRIVASA